MAEAFAVLDVLMLTEMAMTSSRHSMDHAGLGGCGV